MTIDLGVMLGVGVIIALLWIFFANREDFKRGRNQDFKWVLTLAIVAICLGICFRDAIRNVTRKMNSNQTSQVKTNEFYDQFRKIDYEGHSYIIWTDKMPYHSGIVHAPDCSKCLFFPMRSK